MQRLKSSNEELFCDVSPPIHPPVEETLLYRFRHNEQILTREPFENSGVDQADSNYEIFKARNG
jgi:hypothetical protein